MKDTLVSLAILFAESEIREHELQERLQDIEIFLPDDSVPYDEIVHSNGNHNSFFEVVEYVYHQDIMSESQYEDFVEIVRNVHEIDIIG